jgi:hypothetical protein
VESTGSITLYVHDENGDGVCPHIEKDNEWGNRRNVENNTLVFRCRKQLLITMAPVIAAAKIVLSISSWFIGCF